jgi:predicted nucleotidyltransferase
MTQKDYEIAMQLRERISSMTEISDIRVFGSRARGDNDEDSDMDGWNGGIMEEDKYNPQSPFSPSLPNPPFIPLFPL